jgi:hypothetical protein
MFIDIDPFVLWCAPPDDGRFLWKKTTDARFDVRSELSEIRQSPGAYGQTPMLQCDNMTRRDATSARGERERQV